MAVPQVIKLDKLNQALVSLNLRPLDTSSNGAGVLGGTGQQWQTHEQQALSFLSEKVTQAVYKPIEKLKAFIGNMGDLPQDTNYIKLPCDQVQYTAPSFEAAEEDLNFAASEPIPIDDNLDEIKVLLEGTEYRSLVTKYQDDPTVAGAITAKKWYRFSGKK
ncbi:unnamed protein product [Ambrosiozyma monospora]|uniref:Unnamed protein product n=1 Tax=Ambrosiozyma monospora TaxID=43982 RepID=A0ACB5TZ93_AMBMO|nr:unnamed protein product [Ambrosiozyma monospora]